MADAEILYLAECDSDKSARPQSACCKRRIEFVFKEI